MIGGPLIREARTRARLTQSELARRAGTTQSAVARWESGRSQPSIETVRRLTGACGFDLNVRLTAVDPDLLSRIEQNLALSPTQRFDQLVAAARFVQAGRRALAGTR